MSDYEVIGIYQSEDPFIHFSLCAKQYMGVNK